VLHPLCTDELEIEFRLRPTRLWGLLVDEKGSIEGCWKAVGDVKVRAGRQSLPPPIKEEPLLML
jgi:hypothetical protein